MFDISNMKDEWVLDGPEGCAVVSLNMSEG